MCGRAYHTYTDEELHLRYLNQKAKADPLGQKPNYNLAPTQISPIVFLKDGNPVIELFRWGLVPFWANDVKSADKYSMINARCEEIAEKRSYKSAYEKRRCIVPISGFFEWQRNETEKIPYAIYLRDHSIMSVAGVYEHWESKSTDEKVDSFSIVTTAGNSFMKEIHDRMPVILDPDGEKLWLDPATDLKVIKKLMKPLASDLLEGHAVSKLVNSPKNNTPMVLEPAG